MFPVSIIASRPSFRRYVGANKYSRPWIPTTYISVKAHGTHFARSQAMKSRAALGGHPLHPIFVTIPIGLWSFVPVCDLIYLLGWGDASWKTAAFYCIGGGLIGAVPAIITGWIDYGIVEGKAAALVAKFHLILNVVVSIIFLVSFGLRFEEFKTNFRILPAILTFVGAAILGVSGWLGGELVSRFGISVHRQNQIATGN
jgi:uncharacterized membrane protein